MSNPVFDALVNTTTAATTSEALASHMEGFVRSNRGSYIEGLDTMTKTVNFLYAISTSCVEVDHNTVNSECPGAAREGVRYFKFSIPDEVIAYEAVVLLEDLKGAALNDVRVREGSHGYEFYIPDVKFNPGRVATGWIILGPTKDVEGDVVYTWYPGRMTAGTSLNKHAVKLNS